MAKGESHKWKSFFYSRWFLLGIFVFVVLIIFVFVRAYYRDYQVKQEINRLQDEVRQLGSKKSEILDLLKFAQSSDFVEQQARTQLNLVKPGEQATIITPSSGSQNNTRQENEKMIKSDHVSNPLKWWKYFFSQ